jgi:ACS family hexuronate transporter-like MFS transporter
MSDPGPRSRAWRWYVSILLLAATTINYLDRQALSTAADRILRDLHLDPEQYGDLETGFSLSFAAGSLIFGILADRLSIRWLYPVILVGWSVVGCSTGLVRTHAGLLACRTFLGFFEAGHWPCALRIVQRIHERKDRAMGNSLLQSGSSAGAILTPLLVQVLLSRGYSWRVPFVLIGVLGGAWAFFWLASVRERDLAALPPEEPSEPHSPSRVEGEGGFLEVLASSRFLALVFMISCINSSWQILRAWLPLFLQRGRGYDEAFANYFTSAYYGAAGAGSLLGGLLSLGLAGRGVSVHASRVAVFAGGALLALQSSLAAHLPRGFWLLAVLLLVGAGLLGVFSSYYAFAQDISVRHQGKVNGVLGVCAWVSTALLQKTFGHMVKVTGSYDKGVAWVGWGPLVALVVFVILWKRRPAWRTS